MPSCVRGCTSLFSGGAAGRSAGSALPLLRLKTLVPRVVGQVRTLPEERIRIGQALQDREPKIRERGSPAGDEERCPPSRARVSEPTLQPDAAHFSGSGSATQPH